MIEFETFSYIEFFSASRLLIVLYFTELLLSLLLFKELILKLEVVLSWILLTVLFSKSIFNSFLILGFVCFVSLFNGVGVFNLFW